MKLQIGYFIPEFPGQTHIFFWRERQALLELGIETDLVSTQRPPKALASHTWAEEAQKNTTYLFPFNSIQDLAKAVLEIYKAGPKAWLRCLFVIKAAKDTSVSQKLNLFGMVLIAGKLSWLAKRKGWSHVHVQSCANAANIAMFASIISGITYSLTLHGPTLEGYGSNQHQKWKYASFALIVSEPLLKVAKDKLANCLPQQIAVVPVGVNLTDIKRQTPYIPWQPDSPCIVYSCGRLNPVKGHKDLIDAVEILRQRGFDVRLRIAGEDEQGGKGYRQTLEKIIANKGLSEYVQLLGAISEQMNRKGFEDAHIFALASLNEGISVAAMEAMAMEMPVIVTDVGGMYELIDNGVDGIMVQPEQPEEMADTIARVLCNKDLALKLSQESRKKIAAKFHHRRSAEALARCLESLG